MTKDSQILYLHWNEVYLEEKPTKKTLALVVITVVFFMLFANSERIYGLLFSPQPDFEVAANPTHVFLNRYAESSNSTVINIESINGYSGNVALKTIKGFGMIGDVELNLDYENVFLDVDGNIQVSLELEVKSYITPGEYYVDVVATSNAIKHTIRVLVTIPWG